MAFRPPCSVHSRSSPGRRTRGMDARSSAGPLPSRTTRERGRPGAAVLRRAAEVLHAVASLEQRTLFAAWPTSAVLRRRRSRAERHRLGCLNRDVWGVRPTVGGGADRRSAARQRVRGVVCGGRSQSHPAVATHTSRGPRSSRHVAFDPPCQKACKYRRLSCFVKRTFAARGLSTWAWLMAVEDLHTLSPTATRGPKRCPSGERKMLGRYRQLVARLEKRQRSGEHRRCGATKYRRPSAQDASSRL